MLQAPGAETLRIERILNGARDIGAEFGEKERG
jgi:hypothetical protein